MINFEARKFGDAHQAASLADWCGGTWYSGTQHGHTRPPWQQHTCIMPDTAPGSPKTHADIGDWIIKGVKGEFYPCKPDIFAATYEAVS